MTKFMVGGRVFEYPPMLENKTTKVDLDGQVIMPNSDLQPLSSHFAPTLCCEFEADFVWSRIVKKQKIDPTTEEGLTTIKEDAYQCFLSPDESMACFYTSRAYIAIMDVGTKELVWFHQFEGAVEKYVVRKPLFHPTRRILAWVEHLGKEGEDSNEKWAGLWMVEM